MAPELTPRTTGIALCSFEWTGSKKRCVATDASKSPRLGGVRKGTAQMMSYLGHSSELFKDVVDEHNPQSLEMLSTS